MVHGNTSIVSQDFVLHLSHCSKVLSPHRVSHCIRRNYKYAGDNLKDWATNFQPVTLRYNFPETKHFVLQSIKLQKYKKILKYARGKRKKFLNKQRKSEICIACSGTTPT
ncbi:hypothetical protein D9V84_04120 [Bacteroidetes/Chlorobi group bacterium Naka2016]|nr:MAG: hypothetical protein D9V84_04120 [Bacteroidetes/Chlorobi group bacterium Naka2016]